MRDSQSPVPAWLAESRLRRREERILAAFADKYASQYVLGSTLFAVPRWSMGLDREWESAVNVLQRNGYKV